MLSELCVRRPVFATMLVTSLVVLGLFSFRDLGVDLFPKADPATVNVNLKLPGASPDEMTTAVVMPMENALSGISGIDQLQAEVQANGTARITLRFLLDRDLDDAANNVREKVAGAMKNVPPEVLPPIIQKADPDADPIMSLVLSSKGMSLRALTEIADKTVKRNLESVDGVADVTIQGGLPREVHIVVDIQKLNARGLSIDQVRDAIQKENVETPGGTLEQGKWEVGLRTLGRIDAADQFNNIIVSTTNGTPVRIADVGYAEDSVQRLTTALFQEDGSQAVQLDIRRASGENTVRVTDGVKAKLRTVRQALPRAVNMTLSTDDSKFINASVESLEEHLLWGSLLAAVVVMFFIRNIRAVIISALAIPASIIATFTLMRAMDFTLNNMTLLGLTLAVGIVIDDAIVVLENIFRHMEEEGAAAFQAAINGTREVTLAVVATSVSLVVIFLPVAFMTGYSQRFIYPFGLTMAFAVMVSLLVSLTLTPMLSARVVRTDGRVHRHGEGFFGKVDRFYRRSLEWSLDHRAVIVVISLVVFASTFVLTKRVGRSFLPNEDMGDFQLVIDTPEGTSLAGTEKALIDLTPDLLKIDGVAHVMPTVFERVNHSHIFIQLKPRQERSRTQEQIAADVRTLMAAHPSYKPTIVMRTPIGGGESSSYPIQVNLTGPDLRKLSDYALQLLQKLQPMPALSDLKAVVNLSNPELRVAVDRQRAADLGVRVGDLARALRLMVSGEDEISSYRERGERYPVTIRVREEQRANVGAIGSLMVPSSQG